MEKSIVVPNGTTVRWRVYCDGYEEESGIETITGHKRLMVDLELIPVEIDIIDYEFTNKDNIVTLTKYIGSETNVIMPVLMG